MGGNTDTQVFTITVQQVNDPPELQEIPLQYSYVDEDYSLQLNVVDPDNETLMYELFDAPFGMSVDNTGEISWFPESTGYYANILIRVSDDEFSVEQIFDVDIKYESEFVLHTGNNLISFMGLNENDFRKEIKKYKINLGDIGYAKEAHDHKDIE